MEKRLSMFLASLFLCVGAALAQVQVKGTIISADDGEPLPGASVKVVGAKTGTVTDINGDFVISVPDNNTRLEISHIGMLPRVIRARNGMRISLDTDNKILDELIVTAYGTQTKAQFTGSASVMNAEELDKYQVTNALDALKGRASGVQINNASGQPGMSSTIRIRGINSLNAASDPLIVVDGSPYDGDINLINPNDIESMTVLKDAASTALYGARGGNGVIMITTKTAQKGKDATITVDAKWGVNQKGTPQYDKISDPAGYYETWYRGLNNYAQTALGMNPNAAWQWSNQNMFGSSNIGNESLGYNVYTVPNGQYLIGQNGKLNPNATLGRMISYGGKEYWLTPDDWEDETYNNALRQDYTVSASGANDRGSFYLSANYLNMDGITAASDYERFSTRMKADYQLKPWLKVGANMSYNHYEQNYLRTDEEGASGSSGNAFAFMNIAPIYPMFIRDANHNIMYDETAHIENYDYGDGTIIGLRRAFLSQSNPISSNRLDTRETEGNNFAGTGTIELRLPYGFTVSSINYVYVDEYRYTGVTNPFFGQYANSKGIVSKEHGRTWARNFQQRIDWRQTYGKNDVEVMVGHEYYKRNTYGLDYYKTNMFSVNNKELAGAIIAGTGSSSKSGYNTESWLGRALYNYDQRYFGELSVVREASSPRFDSKHWWGTFWSASAGWLINKEKFLADQTWIDELKLKASYGENGNDLIGNYLFTNTYTVTNSNDQVSLVPSTTQGNPNISWEKNAKFNIGVDFSFWKRRLEGGIEFYNNKTNDMLFRLPLPVSFGYTGFYDNVGDMVNRGVEIEVRGDIIRNNLLTWSAYANLTTNHNEVTRLPEERRTQHYWTADGKRYDGFSSGSYFYAEGLSSYSYMTHKYAGTYNGSYKGEVPEDNNFQDGQSLWYKTNYKKDADGNYIYLDEDETIREFESLTVTNNYSEADDYIVGDIMPKVYGGFGSSLDIKGFDISADFTYQLGGKVYDSTYASLMSLNSTGGALHKDILNAWTAENPNNDIPRLQYNDRYMAGGSDRFLTSARFLSLQNVTLGYTFPRKATEKLKIQKLRLYFVGDNLYVWSARKGLDPRMVLAGAVNNTYYSAIRTFSGGISVTF
ncbi:MAG: SusC/RagA family TonB-linked outer membrane protein [Bacteroidaceae bacterium]|nr:SusC/RagA family TonB-linked outer membrane protein [Bacteroidaceae bacterium]